MHHIVNNIQLSQNLMCVKNIKNILSMVRFSKYVVMLIFLMEVVALGYNQVWSQTLLIS